MMECKQVRQVAATHSDVLVRALDIQVGYVQTSSHSSMKRPDKIITGPER